jgi:hypothetical protein
LEFHAIAHRIVVSENCVVDSEFHGFDCGKTRCSTEREYPQTKANIRKQAETEKVWFLQFTRQWNSLINIFARYLQHSSFEGPRFFLGCE